MAQIILIDTGPIVAALSRRDRHHKWAKLHFESISEPCLTCEAVLSECFFLLSSATDGKERLCALLDRGIVTTGFSLPDNQPETLRLMRRYSDTPMSFADACLVRMAEMHDASTIFTTDHDFEIYRKNGRQIIPLIKPW
jgi:predicted nucleic acid-binding protein